MNLVVNGQLRSYADGTTVALVVSDLTTMQTGIAVAVNGEVLSRGRWASTALRDDDLVEVLTAVQGG